ncbi:hypothetical protein [Neptunomonas sp.]|uniref:hypothetical protein n=1 Tax=Neptunomonas sp. TaxID=1971898 RepID=UPI003565230F
MMHIPVLNQLETRTEWISFFRRERSYAYITNPLCLVDLQTTYLQITLLKEDMLDGRQATKFSLGSKSSIEPAWKMIKACNWQLSGIIDGLVSLKFNSNARDNAFPGIHRDLTVRKFFAKDKQLLAPTLIGPLSPLTQEPESWSINDVCRLLSHHQYSHSKFLPQPLKPAPLRSMLLKIIDSPYGWTVTNNGTEITLSYLNKALLSIQPDIKKPAPRLQETG